MFLCPKCKESLQDGVKFCTSCGVEIAKIKKTFYCPFCGKENEDGTKICRWCDEKIVNYNVLNEKVDIFNEGGLGNIDFTKIEQDAIDALAEEYGIKYRKVYDNRLITFYERREEVFISKYFYGIDSKVFIRDPIIKSLILEEGVEEIKDETFKDCINLKKVQFPSTMKRFGLSAFDGVYLDTIILSNPTHKNFRLIIKNCCNNEIANDMKLALNIYYGRDMFDQEALSEIKRYSKIEGNLEVIDFKRFREDIKKIANKKREEIKERDKIEKEFSILNGILWTYKGYGSNIILHDSIIEISSSVFKNYKYGKDIQSMFLSSNLKIIGESAFENLKKLKIIEFPETLEIINNYSFANCVKLEYIKVNKKLNTVGVGSFANCKSLKEINIPSVTVLKKSLFESCLKLEKVECPNAEVIEELAFKDCQNLKSIDTRNVKEIKASAFESCKSLKEINLNSNISVIESYAFSNCGALEKINLENVKEIKDNAFYSCSSLKTVDLSKVEKIGVRAFSNSGLKELIIPASVNEISDYAFASCSALNKLELPDNLTKIGVRAFDGLKSLKYVIIPESVVEIGDAAFGYSKKKDSPSLKVIYIPKGKKFKALPRGVKVKKYKIENIDKIKDKLKGRI